MATKRRRTRRSFGAVRKLPSGRYQASYLDPHGTRVNAPSTFTAKTDADAWLAVQRAAIETGTWRGRDEQITVGEFAEQWLTMLQVRDRTRYDYRANYNRWIRPTFGTTAMAAVTPGMVRRWLGIFPSSKPAARANAYRVLSQMFHAAVSDGILHETPVHVKGAGQYERKREGHALTIDEVSRLAEHTPEDRRLAILLAAFCALRPGEVLGLRRRDVDTRAQTLTIRETVSGRRPGAPRTGPVKTSASIRTVHYPSALHDAVLEQLSERASQGPAGHLFPSPRDPSIPLSYGAYKYSFATAVKAAGLEDVKPHDLRHTGATLAAGTGATVRELMARLGHTSPVIAMRYQHSVQERDRSIADALGAALTSQTAKSDQETP
jgi:integrase